MHGGVGEGAPLILEQIDAARLAGARILGPDLGDEAGLPGDGVGQRHGRSSEGWSHHFGGEVEMDLQQAGHHKPLVGVD